jgi:hypothetical protein
MAPNHDLLKLIDARSRLIPQAVSSICGITEKLAEPLEEYLYLLSAIQNSNGNLDVTQQRRFSKFWGLDTLRPTAELRRKFFFLLEKIYATKNFEIDKVLLELRPLARHAFLFSHATKLLHSVNPSLPIIDSKVSKFFGLPPPNYQRKNVDLQLWYSERYLLFKDAYRALEGELRLHRAFSYVESHAPAFRNLTFSKKLDSVITDLILAD